MSTLRKSIAVGLITASGLFFAAPGALAQESGAFRVIASVFHKYSIIKHAGTEVFGGPLQGIATVVESSGGPWVVNAKSRRTCVVFGRRGTEGVDLEAPCTMTDVSGDRWFTISKRNVGGVEEAQGRRRSRQDGVVEWHRQVRRHYGKLHLFDRILGRQLAGNRHDLRVEPVVAVLRRCQGLPLTVQESRD